MSPNEDQLRAALHHGEGDLPDAGVLIAGAVRARQERRRRITSIASGAAVVAVIVTGLTFLVSNRATESASNGDAGGGAVYAPEQSAGRLDAGGGATHGGNPNPATVTRSAAGGSADKAFSIDCPSTFPRLLLPGGGGTDQFGADEPLFTAPVSSIKVCGYGTTHDSTVVTGSTAEDFAARLNNAATSSGPRSACVRYQPQYAFYAIDANGNHLRVVTATPNCEMYQVTNGTAVRWLLFDQLDPLHIAADATPPHNEGSPPR